MSVPFSPDAERIVIAAVLLDTRMPNECLLQAVNQLNSADFFLDSHRKIFSAMVRMAEREQAIDYTTLLEELKSSGHLETVGGSAYLYSCTDGSPRLKNIEQYCAIVRKASAQRQIIAAAEIAMKQAEERGDPGEIAGRLQAEIDSVTERIQSQNCTHVANIGPGLCRRLISDFDKQGDTVGLPTGIRRLDRALGGLVQGENIVVAAHTGGGKTALALNVIETNCLNDTPVTMYSFELDRDALLIRLAAKRCGIPQIRIRNKAISRDELMQIMAEVKEIERWPFWIDDRSGMTPRELYASGRMQAARGCKLFVSDYLQRFASQCPGHTVREQVNCASGALTAMAKDSKVPVLNLSQITRPMEKTAPRKPTIYDLKESGNIEQDAHTVVLLHREFEVMDGITRPTHNDSIIVGKNRNGPLIEIAAEFDGQLMHWKEQQSYIPEERQYEHRYEQ